LLAAARVLGERAHAGLAHGVGEEEVGLLCALVGPEVVALLEVDRIDARERDELLDVDGRARRGLERLELLVGEQHVLILAHLVALAKLAALDRARAARAEELLADARA